MGIAAALTGAAAAASLGSTISNAVGGSSPSNPNATQGGNPATYIPTNQAGADQSYQNITNQIAPYASALLGETIPGYQAYSGNIQSNPYGAQALSGAQSAATAGANQVAPQQFGGANSLYGAAGQVLNAGFDPQQALYNQQVSQLQNQFGAANAQAGVSGPAAAGVTDQGLTNFDLNWQNQQLGREESSLTSAGQGYSGASSLGDLGIGTLSSSSTLPYSTYLGQQQTDISALGSLASGTNAAFGPDESLANLLQSYLGLGQSATGLAQAGQATNSNQQQTLGNQFGQSLTGLGSSLSTLFGGNSSNSVANYTPTGYSTDYSGYGTSYDDSSDLGAYG